MFRSCFIYSYYPIVYFGYFSTISPSFTGTIHYFYQDTLMNWMYCPNVNCFCMGALCDSSGGIALLLPEYYWIKLTWYMMGATGKQDMLTLLEHPMSSTWCHSHYFVWLHIVRSLVLSVMPRFRYLQFLYVINYIFSLL